MDGITKTYSDINEVLAEIAASIEATDVDSMFERFTRADSIHLDADLSDTWMTIDSQSDTGDDGGWGSSARLSIEYGDNLMMEIEADKTVGNDDIHETERAAYDELIDQILTFQR